MTQCPTTEAPPVGAGRGTPAPAIPVRAASPVRPTRLTALLLCLLLAAPALGSVEAPATLVARSVDAMGRDPEASRALAEQALAAAGDDADTAVHAHLQLCDYHSERDRERALSHLADAAAWLPRLKRSGLRAGLLACEGEVHEIAGDNARAMALYEQAVTVADAAADREMLGTALVHRGYLRGLQGEFALGLADLKRAVAQFEAIGAARRLSIATNAVAILYNRMGDHAQARHFFELALERQRAEGLLREQLVTEHNLARVLERLADWDAAQRHFTSVAALGRELGYARGAAYGLRGLAGVANARGRAQQALDLLAEAERLQRRTPDERLRAQIALQRGVALRLLGRPAEAVAVLRDAQAVFARAESPAELADAHGELAAALSALAEWRQAFDHQARSKAVSEGLLRRQIDQRFAHAKVEFDLAARERETAALAREMRATERALAAQRQANTLQTVALVLAALLVAALAMLGLRQRRHGLRLRDLAMTDELTGLPNRRRIVERLQHMLDDPAGGAVLIADIDRFKAINDELGHPVGDEVLRAVAAALRDTAERHGGGERAVAAGRLGGEEFLLVAPGFGAAAAHALAERLRERVARLDVSRWVPHGPVTISLGITVRGDGDDVTTLLRRADEALYRAKADGRNRAVLRDGEAVPVA